LLEINKLGLPLVHVVDLGGDLVNSQDFNVVSGVHTYFKGEVDSLGVLFYVNGV